ncbi:MAG: hemoglobin/transferrin/lactoferrin receptor protein [Halioglobus sp.]
MSGINPAIFACVPVFHSYANGPFGFAPYTNLTWMERRNEFADFSSWDTGIPALSGRAGLRWEGAAVSIPVLWADVYMRGETSSDLEEPGSACSSLNDKDSWLTVNFATGIEFGKERQYQLSLELMNFTDRSYLASTENLYGVERSIAAKFTADW